MDGTTKVGAYIKHVRESKNLGVNQLAQYAGVSAAQISRIENGKRENPKPETLAKLAKALKVDYDHLMSLAGYLDEEAIINGFEKEEEKENSPIPSAVKTFLRADTSGLTKKEQELLAEDLADYFEFRKNQLLRDKEDK